MKSIIFVINNLDSGGVQSSLLNLIGAIHDKCHVTLVCFHIPSTYAIPNNVTLVIPQSPFRYLGIAQRELKHQPIQYVIRSIWAVVIKLFGRSLAIRLMLPFQKTLGSYDCAISFLHEGPQKSFYGGCNEFVLRKVRAKKKVAWLHCDFEQCGANNKASERIYRQFDEIVACSEGTRQAFLRCMPQFEEKCVTIRNCNDYGAIRRLAGSGIPYDPSVFHIVTVARLSEEKGIERALLAIKQCVAQGHNLHYHIVGWGSQAEHLKELTEAYDLTDSVTFYGNQSNPYPYMKNADLFLLPSYHEAAPMVFDEAACLGVPVLATKTISTDEMLIRSGFGLVCENSQAGITGTLVHVLEHPEQLTQIRETLHTHRFTNRDIAERLNGVINGSFL